MNNDLTEYYKSRAAEYEKIYSKPERQKDLIVSAVELQKLFHKKEVIEIACGTGYWTELISRSSTSILATDINQEVINIAETKTYKCPVTFEVADLYTIGAKQKFNALFGGFIWSHILLQDLDRFITSINELVVPGGLVVIMDNKYVEGSSTPIFQTDELGNTYQQRNLEDGSIYKVLKNFPTEEFLRSKLSAKGKVIGIKQTEYFWILSYCSL